MLLLEVRIIPAVNWCIEICMDQGILTDFLKRNGGDIVSFLYATLTREECEAIREEDGYMRGVLESKIEMARNMLKDNMEHNLILKYTKLSEDELKELL